MGTIKNPTAPYLGWPGTQGVPMSLETASRIQAAWTTANQTPVCDLINRLLPLGLRGSIDALAAELDISRDAASLLVFEHGLSEPLPSYA